MDRNIQVIPISKVSTSPQPHGTHLDWRSREEASKYSVNTCESVESTTNCPPLHRSCSRGVLGLQLLHRSPVEEDDLNAFYLITNLSSHYISYDVLVSSLTLSLRNLDNLPDESDCEYGAVDTSLAVPSCRPRRLQSPTTRCRSGQTGHPR
jgi:hypothetical protein